MDNAERLRILSVIDQFREHGISEDISLPQLVVVGDQSSGKSSLLEGLTGIAFPVASGLCTRFATQIVLRRTPASEGCVKVSIIPGPSASLNEPLKEALLKYGFTMDKDGLDGERFATILNEAAELMGLPHPNAQDVEDLEKRFSDDILKIELSGPEHHHLSVVDVPGLFHNPTKYQTKEDLEIIRGLIENYVTDTRTIILAVMDAHNNLANQEVFSMARAADPEGARTVGIITKCDALEEGDEAEVLKVAQNTVERLNHGWFCVRNRSTKEIQQGVTLKQRNSKEKQFFATAPWNALKKDRVGVLALKRFLGDLLYRHVCAEFPALKKEIEGLARKCQEELLEMGPPRQTSTEQRQFLTRIASRYQYAVDDCLSGRYEAGLVPSHPSKLRMHLRNLNDEFAGRMDREGHRIPFKNITGEIDEEYAVIPQDGWESADQDIYEWIRRTYRESRGPELPGTVNPAVLELMFRQQASGWKGIAEDHVGKVEKAVFDFNKALLTQIIAEERIRERVEGLVEPIAGQAVEQGRSQLRRLLNDEMAGILQTVNHYFANTLSKIRQDRVLARLKGLGLQDGQQQHINLDTLVGAANLSNEDQAVNDIHDILKAYYKVALKRFTDNVVTQVVERCFVGADGPVKILCPEFIGGITEAELAKLAAESYSSSRARTDIRHRSDRLSEALKLARTIVL
ncbi:MAG: hypothetical protein M1832_000471 [Thelocarpon impressellum]|nr:MAG: hypothetical protein M1832_000471 [Thelocarpon impressellum]